MKITPLFATSLVILSGCQAVKDPGFWIAFNDGFTQGARAGTPNYAFTQPKPILVPQPAATSFLDRAFGQLEGAKLVAQDGTFLGVLSSNRADAQSIANPYGRFGSKVSPVSIFNEVGLYGSEAGVWSPWNPVCACPPLIIMPTGEKFYLTKNQVIGGVDPALVAGIVQALQG